MSRNVSKRQNSITEKKSIISTKFLNCNSEELIKASYVAANLIAKETKTITDGEFIKQCIDKVADIVCPDRFF